MERANKDDITFVARHYRRGSFDTRAGWRRLAIAPTSAWRRIRVAAAVAAAIAVGATATFIYNGSRPEEAQTAPAVTAAMPETLRIVKTIDFEDAPLPTVVTRIEEVYGVKVTNLPDDASGYRLTLRYEGTAPDLVATINELLGTEMEAECDGLQ